MSATSKTPNFNLPLYNPTDTIAFIPDWNNFASDVDTAMQINKTLGNQNSANIETINTSITEINDNINIINNFQKNLILNSITPLSKPTYMTVEYYYNKIFITSHIGGYAEISNLATKNGKYIIATFNALTVSSGYNKISNILFKTGNTYETYALPIELSNDGNVAYLTILIPTISGFNADQIYVDFDYTYPNLV